MTSTVTIKIKKAASSDSKRILEIRNHPAIRKNSHNSSAIPFHIHDQWFKKQYFSDGNNYCFVAGYDNQIIGYCRYDLDSDKKYLLVSIAIDPTMQGKGIGNTLLKNTLSILPQDKEIRAEILINNLPSLKLFQKNNFIVHKTDDNSYYLKYLGNK